MSALWKIAGEEVRYWARSQVAKVTFGILIGLTLVSAVVTVLQMTHAAQERQHLQHEAEEAFRSQPDRHPHRMVHYGHYVFRSPAPLSVVDPGMDAYSGTAIFLEGHRQNSATFSEQQSGGVLGVFGSLTPAFILQVLTPLLLILMGYGAVTRERESGTLAQILAQGVPPTSLMAGKGLALCAVGMILLLPAAAAAIWAATTGEAVFLTTVFLTGYAVYLLVWCGIVVFVSSRVRSSSGSLVVLISVWIVITVLVPPIASSASRLLVDAPGKIETDFAMKAELDKQGDGHNASDPAFARLKAELLDRYDVDRVEDLPVNFRGIVAGQAEANLTDVLNRYAEDRMAAEEAQTELARGFGWLSPIVSVRAFSMILAGTDLATHHRFLREAEAVRFAFVQALNKAHEEQLSYADDIRRSNNADAEKKTRISAENWQILKDFRFRPAPPEARLQVAGGELAKLLAWLVGVWALCVWTARSIKP